MFEWWYEFWTWLGDMVSSGKIWKPYESMGFWFFVVVIAFTAIYVWLVFGGKKDDEDEENIKS